MSREPRWVDEGVDDLHRLARDAPPALRRRLEAQLARMSRMNGAADLRDVLTRPASTPFVPLIEACADDLGLADDPRAALVGRSTVALYAYVRLQDDLVDEPALVDRASVYAAEALLSLHLRHLAAAAPEAGVMALRSEILLRFAGVAAAEVDDRGADVTDGDLGWMGEKFLPMAVPLAALAVVAGRPHLADGLVALVREAGCALQLLNDLYNVAEDAAGARPTPLLRWLVAEGVDTAAPRLRARVFEARSFARCLDHARGFAAQACERAAAMELPRVGAVARGVGAMVDAAPERMMRQLLVGSV